jgi:hypothetical protein
VIVTPIRIEIEVAAKEEEIQYKTNGARLEHLSASLGRTDQSWRRNYHKGK